MYGQSVECSDALTHRLRSQRPFARLGACGVQHGDEAHGALRGRSHLISPCDSIFGHLWHWKPYSFDLMVNKNSSYERSQNLILWSKKIFTRGDQRHFRKIIQHVTFLALSSLVSLVSTHVESLVPSKILCSSHFQTSSWWEPGEWVIVLALNNISCLSLLEERGKARWAIDLTFAEAKFFKTHAESNPAPALFSISVLQNFSCDQRTR